MSTTTSELPPPADDELVTQILARRRRRTPILTLALVVAVAAGAAFVGGAEAQKHFGSHGTPASRGAGPGAAAALRSALAARFGGGKAFAGGFGGSAGGVTAGTVTLIRGDRLYVTDGSGNTVIVDVGATARVSKTVSGSVRTVRPGDTVTVIGTRQKDGSYAARTVAIGPVRGAG